MKKWFTLLVLVFSSVSVMVAQSTITGTITDESGEPLIGANVLAKGTSEGTVTDFDGYFSLEVPDGTEELTISYTGYATQDVALGTSTNLSIVLQEGVALGEVVVTALGLAKDSRKLGYAVETVGGDEIRNTGEADIVSSLNSKAAGVQITSSSGTPGASTNIRIRGATSISGGNSPLFVIDGVPIDNSTNNAGGGAGNTNTVDGVATSNRAMDINPNDVESMSILKGAAATALYGIRAANGVVLITTKKGAEGKPRVTFNARYQLDEVNKLPDLQSTYAQGTPDADGNLVYQDPFTFQGASWGPRLSDLEYDGATDYPFDRNGRLVPRGQGNGTPARAYDPYDLFVTGQTYDVNLGIRGGTEKVKYYFSASRLESQGIIPNADWARNSIRINTDFQATDKLAFQISANYIQSGGERVEQGSNLRGVMLGLLRNPPSFDVGNGKTGQEAADDPTVYTNPDGTQRSYRHGIYDNPYWVVNKNLENDNVNRIIGYTGLTYDFTSDLRLTYKLGVDHFTDNRLSHTGIVPDPFGTNWSDGSVRNLNFTTTDLNSDLVLTWGKQLTKGVRMDLTGGHNYLRQRFTRRETNGLVLNIPDFYHISNATNVNSIEEFVNRDIIGLFGVADFNINDVFFVNGTVRNDWSSTLAATDNPSFLSYSANLGFAFSELLPNTASWLDFGKLRLSYGSNGNDALVFATTPYLEGSVLRGDAFLAGERNNQFPFTGAGVNSFELDNVIANPNLEPERTTTYEVGLQMDFFRGRFGFDVTYYDATSEDLIIGIDVSGASGGTDLIANAAEITNSGWEVLMNVTPVRRKNFEWTSDFNFTAYENDVESLAEGVENILFSGFTSTSSRAVAGQPYGAIFGNGFQRDDQGRLLIADDGFPVIDPILRVQGDPNPDFTLGWRNTFRIAQNFTVSALLDIREGGDVWCGTCGIIDYFGTSQRSGDLRDDMITFEGVSAADGSPVTSTVPYFDPSQGLDNGNFFRRYGFGGTTESSMYDGSWVRLREVSLGYNLPRTMIEKVGLENAGITVSGRNLWLQTDFPGIDPETNLTGATNGFGLDYFNNPNTRSYSVALNLTF